MKENYFINEDSIVREFNGNTKRNPYSKDKINNLSYNKQHITTNYNADNANSISNKLNHKSTNRNNQSTNRNNVNTKENISKTL